MSKLERNPRQFLEFLYLLARMELKARYKGRLFGYLGSVGATFALAFVFWIAFKVIMRLEMDNYSVYLLASLFPWIWMSMSVIGAARGFVANAPLLREMGLSHAILPLSNVMAEAMHFALALPLIIAWVAVAGGYQAAYSWLWQIPLMMALQAAFVFPMALVCALANAFLRDIENLLGMGFLLLFFVTPMIYPVSMVPEPLRHYFELNPLHALMQSWRSVFIDKSLHAADMAYVAAFAAAGSVLAWLIYRKLAPRISEVV